MSIEKLNPRIHGETIPYTQVDSRVVQKIRNTEVLAVWVYLLTLPPDWNVVKAHVKEHFGIGKEKLKQIFSTLRKHRLIEYVQDLEARGRFGGMDIRILNGSQFKEKIDEKEELTGEAEIAPAVLTTGLKSPPTVITHIESGFAELSTGQSTGGPKIGRAVKPSGGQMAPTDKTLLTEKRKKIERPSLLTFQPSQAAQEAATAKGVDISGLLEKFKLHYGHENEFARNWPELFHKWILSEKIDKKVSKSDATFADVTKQSTSAGHEPCETPEESQRKWEERMREYGRPLFSA